MEMIMEIAKRTQDFSSTFAELGLSADVQENVMASLIVACHLLGEREHTCIDDAYREIFSRSFARDEKVTNLLVLKGVFQVPYPDKSHPQKPRTELFSKSVITPPCPPLAKALVART